MQPSVTEPGSVGFVAVPIPDDGRRRSILGVRVTPTDYASAVEATLAAAKERRSFGLSALAVHGVMTGFDDLEQRFRLNALDMVVPDGQPVRWALNLLHGCDLRDRVYGPTLMLRVCAAAAASDLSVFLYGSTDDVLGPLAVNLEKRFPGLRIAGTRPSLFRPVVDSEEAERIAAEIEESGAAICFVGLGCPRQEVFVYEFRDRIQMPLLAVGAAFEFHAGASRQAPPVLQRAGLEWLYRLLGDPRRLWRRYLLLNPRYLWAVAKQRFGSRHAEDPGRRPAHPLGHA